MCDEMGVVPNPPKDCPWTPLGATHPPLLTSCPGQGWFVIRGKRSDTVREVEAMCDELATAQLDYPDIASIRGGCCSNYQKQPVITPEGSLLHGEQQGDKWSPYTTESSTYIYNLEPNFYVYTNHHTSSIKLCRMQI